MVQGILLVVTYHGMNLLLFLHLRLREAVASLQKAGGTYSLVALSPNVGLYEGGRFSSNVPMRVIQPLTHPNNSIDMKTEAPRYPIIKQEGHERKRRRQYLGTI